MGRRSLLSLVLVVAFARTAVANRFEELGLGDPITVSQLGNVGALALGWVRDAYGIDADQVPVYLLPGDRFQELYRTLGGRAMGMGVTVAGFAYRDVVFVKKGGLTGIPARTLTHEILHALSTRFSEEAGAHSNLVEGVTEYFTTRACPPQKVPRGVRLPKSTYGAYAEFAAALAAFVGVDKLAQFYFDDGYRALERLVDRRLGKGQLRRAAKYLEINDLDSALAILAAGDRRSH